MKKLIPLLIALALVSCTDAIPTATTTEDAESWADTAWHEAMDTHYVFWDLDAPAWEWDALYDAYLPRFEALTSPIGADKTETVASYRLFYDIVARLSDGHYALRLTDTPGDEGITIGAAEIDKLRAHGFEDDAIFSAMLADTYMGEMKATDLASETPDAIVRNTFGLIYDAGYYGMITDEMVPLDAFSDYVFLRTPSDDTLSPTKAYAFTGLIGRMHDGTLYVLLSLFTATAYLDDIRVHGEATSLWGTAIEAFIGEYREMLSETETGVIVDLRGNRGGLAYDLTMWWAPLIEGDITFAYTRRKIGGNKLAYGPWQPWHIEGTAEERIDYPIAVLINSATASCGEISALALRELGKRGYDVTLIGSLSYGAFGAIAAGYNAGTFSLPSYVELVYTPMLETVDSDIVTHEGKGVPVDVYAEFDADAFRRGDDGRLRLAREVVSQGDEG